MSFKPPPSRLELIRLRRQLALFLRMKKTLEEPGTLLSKG